MPSTTRKAQKAGDSQYVQFLRPGQIAGENCTVDPLALAPGEFPLLQNIRLRERVAVVRQGCTKLTSTVLSGATSCVGSWSGTLNNTPYVVAAFNIGGGVAIFALNTSTYVWTELTGDGTPAGFKLFGSTRLPTNTGPVSFCKLPLTWEASRREVLLVSNPGNAYPIMWDPAAASGFQMSKLNPLNASVAGNQGAYTAQALWSNFINQQTVVGTPTSSGGGLSLTFAGVAPSRALGISYSIGTASGAWAAMAFGTPLNCTQAQQIIFRVIDLYKRILQGRRVVHREPSR